MHGTSQSIVSSAWLPLTVAASSSSQPPITRLPPWLTLLGRFYARRGLPLPAVEALKGEELPEPYRRLLVHSNDMTPTLEAFHGQPLRITVLGRERDAGTYLREVLLRPAVNGGPVEYGVIRIRLNQLPTEARKIVLAEERPLGNILQTEAIPHLSWPQSYFRVEADTHLNHVLGLLQPGTLYGRRNLLLTASRRLLAEVIEVLPPAPTNEDFKS